MVFLIIFEKKWLKFRSKLTFVISLNFLFHEICFVTPSMNKKCAIIQGDYHICEVVTSAEWSIISTIIYFISSHTRTRNNKVYSLINGKSCRQSQVVEDSSAYCRNKSILLSKAWANWWIKSDYDAIFHGFKRNIYFYLELSKLLIQKTSHNQIHFSANCDINFIIFHNWSKEEDGTFSNWFLPSYTMLSKFHLSIYWSSNDINFVSLDKPEM